MLARVPAVQNRGDRAIHSRAVGDLSCVRRNGMDRCASRQPLQQIARQVVPLGDMYVVLSRQAVEDLSVGDDDFYVFLARFAPECCCASHDAIVAEHLSGRKNF